MKNSERKNEGGFSLIELLIVSVILTFVIGITAGIVFSVQRTYAQQRPRTESLNEATAALDMMTRLIRMAGNNPNNISGGVQGINAIAATGGVSKKIQIRGDWRGNTTGSGPDGDIADSFENITFEVLNNRLMKQEPSDAGTKVIYLDNVNDLSFRYFNTNNVLITDPVATPGQIARVEISVVMQPPNSPSMTFTSSTYLRQFLLQ